MNTPLPTKILILVVFSWGVAATLYLWAILTGDELPHTLGQVIFRLSIASIIAYGLVQNIKQTKAKHKEEMDQLKQKERQLYADALQEWLESPPTDK